MSSASTAEERFTQAADWSAQGRYGEAIAAFERLASETPDDVAVFLKLGEAHWNAGTLPQAESAFRQATLLAPDAELASVALFHVLWEQDREDEAFAEARRYLSTNQGVEYRQLLKEMGEDLSTEQE